MRELEPADRPARGRRRRPPRPAAPARRGGRAALRVGGRGRRGDPDARGSRGAGDRRRRGVRARPRRCARRGPRRGLPRSRGSRPTAVNLVWALDEMRARADARTRACGSTRERSSAAGGWRSMRPTCSSPAAQVLTHCNTGGLATGGYGTALGGIRAAWERGLVAHVWVDETRPLLQGARLTAWELETARHSARRHRRRRRSVADGAGARSTRRHRRRPDRRQRRHGEQGRHLRARRARAPPRHPALRRRADARRSTSRRRPARGSRSRSATAAEVTPRFAAHNPAFDVTPGGACLGDRDRARRPSCAVRRVAGRTLVVA